MPWKSKDLIMKYIYISHEVLGTSAEMDWMDWVRTYMKDENGHEIRSIKRFKKQSLREEGEEDLTSSVKRWVSKIDYDWSVP